MKVIKSSEVCSYIKDGDTIFITGMTLGGFAEEATVEIEKNFLAGGHPRDLTFVLQGAIGNRSTRGMAVLAKEGLCKRFVGSHLLGCGPAWGKLAADNAAEIYNFPLGVMSYMPRYIAAKKPGVITKVGLGTFVDPRREGGAMNQRTMDGEKLVELISIHGEEWLLYKLPEINVTLIRGTYADEHGNISMDKEGYKFEQYAAAAAANTCGGIVICQVEKVVKAGTLSPMDVIVPGIMVDYVFESKPEYHWQTAQTVYNPVFAGKIKIPLDSLPIEKLSPRKVIARRAAMELNIGDVVNLGVGIPEAIASVAAEEGVLDLITLTTEAGGVGGMPANKHDFGCCWNAEATIPEEDQFTYYDGSNLDYTGLGALEVDEHGNVNASMLNKAGIGIGGFMNVAAGSKKVMFCILFYGMLKAELGNGGLKILEEGDRQKFLKQVDQVTFNGELAVRDQKEVMFITERAVFQLTPEGVELIEIAPGVDLKKDVLDKMEFTPIMKNVKLMPKELFNEKWGGLGGIMKTKSDPA